MDGKELFLMIEAISNEKNITKEDVLESLEEALAVATKKRSNIEVRVEVDRHTGEFKTFRQLQQRSAAILRFVSRSIGTQVSLKPLGSGKSSKMARSLLMMMGICLIQSFTFIKLTLMD